MQDNMYIDTAKCCAVWERVTNDMTQRNSQPAPELYAAESVRGAAGVNGEAKVLAEMRGLMDITAQNARYCRLIAARCNGRVRNAMTDVYERETCHLKKLRAEYFLLTGDTYCPENRVPAVCAVSESLRMEYANLLRASDGFCAAANNAPRNLSCLYRKYAQDEQKSAEAIVCLIENMMC